MRHAKAGRRFDMPTSQRLAMFRSITQAVIRDGGVHTTQARAKEVQPLVDRMRLANQRWPQQRLPERVRELARRVESYYESGENPKQPVL